MRLVKSIAVVVIVSLFASLSASQAADKQASKKTTPGRYRLVEGKGYTVCEAFLKNLNAFPADEPPMVCEQKIHPTHPEFTKPVWEEMDVQSNLKLIYAAEGLLPQFTRPGEQPLPYDEWLTKFQERIKAGKANPRLRKTMLALNERGRETLISYEPIINQCQANIEYKTADGPGGHVFVLHDKQEAPLESISGSSWQSNDLLIHGDKAYLLWSTGDIDRRRSKEVQVWVWHIRLDAIFPGLSGDNKYVKEDRCDFEVDQLKKR